MKAHWKSVLLVFGFWGLLGAGSLSAQTQVRTSLTDTLATPASAPADNRLRPQERPVVYRASTSIDAAPVPVVLDSQPASANQQPISLPPVQIQTRLPEEE